MPPSEGYIVTPMDFVGAAQGQFAAHLSGLPQAEQEAVDETLRQWGPRCVRIEVAQVGTAEAFAGDLGSGVLLGGGPWVLTAAHVIPAGPLVHVLVTLDDGRSFHARRMSSGVEGSSRHGGDWAVLELLGFEESVAAIVPRRPRNGELAILFGYPRGNMGLDPQARLDVVIGQGQGSRALAPVAGLLRVVSGSDLEFEMIAGLFSGGMSGGPIVSLEGDLLAVASGQMTAVDDVGVQHLVYAAPADRLHRSVEPTEWEVPR